MGLSFSHILILAIIVVLLFGRGKISELMGDVAKGIKSFKKGMSEDDETAADKQRAIDQRTIDHAPAATVTPVAPNVAVDATERERRSA